MRVIRIFSAEEISYGAPDLLLLLYNQISGSKNSPFSYPSCKNASFAKGNKTVRQNLIYRVLHRNLQSIIRKNLPSTQNGNNVTDLSISHEIDPLYIRKSCTNRCGSGQGKVRVSRVARAHLTTRNPNNGCENFRNCVKHIFGENKSQGNKFQPQKGT